MLFGFTQKFTAATPCSSTIYASQLRTASLVDLWCQVELHVAIVGLLQVVLHQQRRIWAQTELHNAAERRSLREVDKVAESKGSSHWLVHSQGDGVFWLLRVAARLQHNVSCTNVASNAELDAFLASAHLHGLAELLEILADLLELARRQASHHLVLLLWDLHVLALNLHQLQVEIRNSIVRVALALKVQSVRVILPLQLERIVGAADLEDLAKGVDVHTQRGRSIALEVGERGLAEHQGHQGNVGAIHGLNLHALLGAIEVHILAEVLHGIHHLLQEGSLLELRL